jgi:hypothetical protein
MMSAGVGFGDGFGGAPLQTCRFAGSRDALVYDFRLQAGDWQ